MLIFIFQIVTCSDEHWDQVDDQCDTWGNFLGNAFDRHAGFSIVFVASCKTPSDARQDVNWRTNSVRWQVNVKFEQMLNANHQFNAVFELVPYIPFEDFVTSEDESDKDFVVDDDELDDNEDDDDDDVDDGDDDKADDDDDDDDDDEPTITS